ncbi:MAG TPA: hypothetical protein VMC85_20865 [Desulfomonilaceae bacterium]|nr:hypothetical protein [Desulfomonilaceae bacterium]
MTIDPQILTNLAKRLNERAERYYFRHELVGPTSVTLKLEAMSLKYQQAAKDCGNEK